MKKFTLIITALFLCSFAFTQSNTEELDLIQAAFGMDKKAIVASFVNPSEAQKDAFWKLYDAWTAKVMALQQKNDKLIATYYKKVKTISNGIVATQFYQIESYILTGIRMVLLDDMPFVIE